MKPDARSIAPAEPVPQPIQRLLGRETQAAFALELGITAARLGNIYNGAELSKEWPSGCASGCPAY